MKVQFHKGKSARTHSVVEDVSPLSTMYWRISVASLAHRLHKVSACTPHYPVYCAPHPVIRVSRHLVYTLHNEILPILMVCHQEQFHTIAMLLDAFGAPFHPCVII